MTQTPPNDVAGLVERVRIMAKQRTSVEMGDEDQERADWQGAYDWFCTESREILAALSPAPLAQEGELDNCQLCLGVKGGVRGNENRLGSLVVCDYCHSALITTGALASPPPVDAGGGLSRKLAYAFCGQLRQSQKADAAKAVGLQLDYDLPALERDKAFLRAVSDAGKAAELTAVVSSMLPADSADLNATPAPSDEEHVIQTADRLARRMGGGFVRHDAAMAPDEPDDISYVGAEVVDDDRWAEFMREGEFVASIVKAAGYKRENPTLYGAAFASALKAVEILAAGGLNAALNTSAKPVSEAQECEQAALVSERFKGKPDAATARSRIEGLSDADAAEEVARIIAAAGHETKKYPTPAECATALRKHVIGIVRSWDARYAPEGFGAGVMIPVECLTMVAAADMLAASENRHDG